MIKDLIYDVGMNNGSDTAYYLFRGYRVVAIEASPILADQARERFKDEIARGQLTLLNVGITEKAGKADFWINDHNSEWSSFKQWVGCRDNTPCHKVEVECLTFKEVLDKHGVPFYLKIDIEGHDVLCLNALQHYQLPRRPQFVSIEAQQLDWLCKLNNLGYQKFKVVNQSLNKKIEANGWKFPPGCSGLFGEDLPGPWTSMEAAAYEWLHQRQGHPERSSIGAGWYDFHAAK